MVRLEETRAAGSQEACRVGIGSSEGDREGRGVCRRIEAGVGSLGARGVEVGRRGGGGEGVGA